MRTSLALAALAASSEAFSPSLTRSGPPDSPALQLRAARTGWDKRADSSSAFSPISSGTSASGEFIGSASSASNELRNFQARRNGSGHEVGGSGGNDWFSDSRGGSDLAGGRAGSYAGPWKLAGESSSAVAAGSTAGSTNAAMTPQTSNFASSERGGVRRRPIVAGNWKLNPATRNEALDLLERLAAEFAGLDSESPDAPEAVIFPPLPYLSDALRILGGTAVRVGAQNCGSNEGGAFTGEVAPSMLASAGCTHVLLGHSERRTLFGETDEGVNESLRRCLDQPGLTVILCVGETLEEYENGLLEDVVDVQVRKGLRGVDASDLLNGRVVIAYEPVWAIGTGLVATPAQAQAAHVAIRRTLEAYYRSSDAARSVRVQYGGSVTPGSISELVGEEDVDGALVGGASLDAESFARIFVGAATRRV